MSTAALFTGESRARAISLPASLRRGVWLRPLCTVPTDIGALLLASVCSSTVLHGFSTPLASSSGLAQITVPLLLLCGAGLYSTRLIDPAVELRKLTGAMALAPMILATCASELPAGKAVVAALLGFCLRTALLTAARTALRSVMNYTGLWLIPTIIVGSGALAQQVFQITKKHRHLGLRAVAVLESPSPDPGGSRSRALIDQFESVVRLAKQSHVSEIVIADAGLQEGDMEAVTYRYQKWFRRIVFVSSFSTLGGVCIRATDLSGLLGLEVNRPVRRHAHQLKRLLDLSLACLLSVLLLPLVAVICALVRLASPGPVFYGHRRIGRNGKYFKAWKFRSMVIDADLVLHQHLQKDSRLREEWERTHKLLRDPRILPIGRFLRQTSLDELPQLWNVIRGEMSLVGPRPIVDAEVPKYGESIEYYKTVRPGVTGMWQISGRSQTSYAERVRYDEYFVKNWSIWLDLYILFRTVKTVLLREGSC